MARFRFCRVCGDRKALEAYRAERRVCRACEARRVQRWRYASRGREVPDQYRDPDIGHATALRIFELERLERARGADAL